MEFNQLGDNSCSSLLIENCNPGQYNWGTRKHNPKDVKSCFVQAVKNWDSDVDSEDDEYFVRQYAFFVIYLTDKQVSDFGDEYEALGFTVTEGVRADKTGSVCHLLFAPVSTVLKNLGMGG